MAEQWIKWEPLEGLPQKMYLERMIDDKNGISLKFKSESDDISIQVIFEDSVLSLRNTDEGRRLKTLDFLVNTHGKDFSSKWSLFKVTDSSYVKWFNEESFGIYADYNVEHYVFLTPNDVFEVLSTYAPKISVS